MRERIQTIGFVIGSMLIHTAALLAITLSPTVLKTISEKDEAKTASESATGEAIQFYPAEEESAYPELADAPEAVEVEAVEPEPVKTEATKPVEVKPVVAKPAKAKAPKVAAKPKAAPKANPVAEQNLPEKNGMSVALMKKADAEKTEVAENEESPAIVVEEEPASDISSESLTAEPLDKSAETESLAAGAAVEAAPTEETEAAPIEEVEQPAEEKISEEASAAIVPGTKPIAEGPAPAVEGPAPAPAVAKQSFTDLEQMAGNRPPVYPEAARLNKAEGAGELRYVVTKDGRVKDIAISKSTGHKDLDLAALEAVKDYKFVPGQEGTTVHPFVFKLKGAELPVKGRLRTTLNNKPITE